MFNDILTGAKTLEPETKKAETDPYRAPGELPPTLVCTSCRKEFPAGQAMAGRCRECAPNVDVAMAAMAGDVKSDYTDYGAAERDREVTWKVISIAITILIAIAWAFMRFGLRGDDY